MILSSRAGGRRLSTAAEAEAVNRAGTAADSGAGTEGSPHHPGFTAAVLHPP